MNDENKRLIKQLRDGFVRNGILINVSETVRRGEQSRQNKFIYIRPLSGKGAIYERRNKKYDA